MDESCPAKWVKGENIETKVLNYLSEILSNPVKLNEALSSQQKNVYNKKLEAEKKLKELDKAMDRLTTERERVLQAYRSGVIELPDLQKSIDDIKNRQKLIEQQIAEIKLSLSVEEEKSKNILEIVKKHRHNWEAVHNLSFEEKRELLMKTVKCIWVETLLDGNIVLDIECYIPASQQIFTASPLVPYEPARSD